MDSNPLVGKGLRRPQPSVLLKKIQPTLSALLYIRHCGRILANLFLVALFDCSLINALLEKPHLVIVARSFRTWSTYWPFMISILLDFVSWGRLAWSRALWKYFLYVLRGLTLQCHALYYRFCRHWCHCKSCSCPPPPFIDKMRWLAFLDCRSAPFGIAKPRVTVVI